MKKTRFGVLALTLVLFLTGMVGVTAVAEEAFAPAIPYDACIDYNDPSIRIRYEGDPVEVEGISTFAACNHSNSYLTGHTIDGYEVWSSTQHVVVYMCNRFCRTCGIVVARNVMYETMETHQGAPCKRCGYNPY